jgi:hypothetical protein
MLHVLAGIAYDPTIRGLLSVGVGVVVLMGSVYLLLATNMGNRLGFLVAATGFFGWMVIMGIVWWIFGIGMKGTDPTWHVIEYNRGDLQGAQLDEARELDLTAVLAEATYEELEELTADDPRAAEDLVNPLLGGGWKLFTPTDPDRGQAEAVVSAEVVGFGSLGISEADDYLVHTGFVIGGKDGLPRDPGRWDRIKTKFDSIVTIKHPPRYAIIQIQRVEEQEAEPGQAPPTPVADETQPIINVIMQRDIGDKRFPSAVVTIGSTIMFAILAWVLHNREKTLLANKAAAAEALAAT